MIQSDNTKEERKASAAAVNDKGAYKETEFGRRRVSKLPTRLASVLRLIAMPILFIYRRVWRARAPQNVTRRG